MPVIQDAISGIGRMSGNQNSGVQIWTLHTTEFPVSQLVALQHEQNFNRIDHRAVDIGPKVNLNRLNRALTNQIIKEMGACTDPNVLLDATTPEPSEVFTTEMPQIFFETTSDPFSGLGDPTMGPGLFTTGFPGMFETGGFTDEIDFFTTTMQTMTTIDWTDGLPPPPPPIGPPALPPRLQKVLLDASTTTEPSQLETETTGELTTGADESTSKCILTYLHIYEISNRRLTEI